MSRLRRLDEEVVPRLAAALRRRVDGSKAPPTAATGPPRPAASRQAASAGSRDARSAPPVAAPPVTPEGERRSGGPLGLLRDVPQLGLLLLAVIFLVVAGVVLVRADRAATTGSSAAPAPGGGSGESQQPLIDQGGGSALLGPEVGTVIASYVQDSNARTVARGETDPTGQYAALVSLATPLAPAQAQGLLGPLQARRVFLRAPVKTGVPEVLKPPVSDLGADLPGIYASTAQRKTADKQEFDGLLRTLDPKTKEEKQFQSFYLAASRTAGEEASAYRSNCGCVVALLVQGPAKALADLTRTPGVRAVELAPRGAEAGRLDVTPLLPGATGTVKEIPSQGSGGA